jgi:hypothetical protein
MTVNTTLSSGIRRERGPLNTAEEVGWHLLTKVKVSETLAK